MATTNPKSAQVLAANTTFACNLYKILSRREGNLFFSPLSVHTVLAMLFHGAEGDTAQALLHTLKNADAEGYKDVINHLNKIEHVKLLMANKIYGNQKKYSIRKEFEDLLSKNFISQFEFLNMSNGKVSAKIVNDWVEEQTDNKIKNIVNEANFNENVSLVLINAIYFKGKWASTFQQSMTKKDNFFKDYKDQNNSLQVDMMYQKGYYDYKIDKDLDAQIIEIPYRGHNTSMMIILPSEKNNINNLEDKIIKSDLAKMREGLKSEEIHLYLPKFKMEETIKLNELLREMGLANIFDPEKANFGKILEEMNPFDNLYVSEILQKAFVKVTEEGTEAAAATRAIMMCGCAPGARDPVVFKVNRPAIFMLVASHGDARNILFFGRLFHPEF